MRFTEGDQQNKVTTGGADNHLDFQVEGLVGNKLYDVNFSWGTRSQEPWNGNCPGPECPGRQNPRPYRRIRRTSQVDGETRYKKPSGVTP